MIDYSYPISISSLLFIPSLFTFPFNLRHKDGSDFDIFTYLCLSSAIRFPSLRIYAYNIFYIRSGGEGNSFLIFPDLLFPFLLFLFFFPPPRPHDVIDKTSA